MPYLCLSSDVPPGSWRQVDLYDEDLLVTRTVEGILRLDRNACPHRGFPMGHGAGRLPLKCGYHGLAFPQSGEYPVFESEGMVWSVALPVLNGSEAEVLRLAALGKEYQQHSSRVDCQWEQWIQNTMDPNHVSEIHPDFCAILEDGAKPFAVNVSEDLSVSSYRVPVKMDYAQRWRNVVGQILSADFFHVTVYPYLSVTSFMGIMGSVETAVPADKGGKLGTLVRTRYFMAPGMFDAIPEAVRAASMEANKKLLQEDRKVCEKWARKRYVPRKAMWLPGEERIQAFLKRCEEDPWIPRLV